MADTGWLTPVNFTELSGGDVAWTNPEDALTDNGLYAEVSLVELAPQANFLSFYNLSASIPSGRTIEGIEVRIDSTGNNGNGTYYAYLTKDATNSAGNLRGFSTASGFQTVGGASDLWGTTLSEAEVEASTFGAMVSAAWDNPVSFIVNLDVLQVKIYYSDPPPTPVTYYLPAQRRGR